MLENELRKVLQAEFVHLAVLEVNEFGDVVLAIVLVGQDWVAHYLPQDYGGLQDAFSALD